MNLRILQFCVCMLLANWLGIVAGILADQPRPNILFFLVDDMGVSDASVSFLVDADGNKIEAPLNARYRTPNMQRMADRGLRFTNAHAYSVCTPTRAALLTGLDATRLHITTWTDPQQTFDTGKISADGLIGPQWQMAGVDPQLPTLPKVLAAAGYKTIHCGKAHFGPNDSLAGNPLNLGFDINIGGSGIGAPGSYQGKNNFSADHRGGGNRWDVPGLEKYHGTDTFLTAALTLELASEIEKTVANQKPFYAYIAHYAVHAPFETDQRFAKNYPDLTGKELAFATMVEGMDKSLGDLIAKLEQLNVAEETLVVFYSDNGSDGPFNLPLNGKKGTRFEGGNRVPLMIAWAKPNPENGLQQKYPIKPGSIEDDLVTPVDFLPTLAAIAGATLPTELKPDGFDLSPYLQMKPGTHRPQNFGVHFPHGQHNNNLFSNYIEGDWKLVYQYVDERWELFNLRTDLSEQNNLVTEQPNQALSMAKRMLQRLDKLGAQHPQDAATGNIRRPNLSRLHLRGN